MAVEECGRHEVVAAGLDPGADELGGAVERHEPHAIPLHSHPIAVAPGESRAGEDEPPIGGEGGRDQVGQGVEPGPAFRVGQRDPARHPFDVGRGVEAIGVLERPPEPVGERPTDDGLADATDPHHDHHPCRHDSDSPCDQEQPPPAIMSIADQSSATQPPSA